MEARIDRALKQRIYLMDHDGVSFQIMGTTSNYNVVLRETGEDYTCTCLDFERRGEYCKHIYFCLFRVLKIDRCKWLEEPFETAAQTIKKFLADKVYLFTHANRKESSECPICYEEYEVKDRKVYCDTCGHSFHDGCINKWIKRSSSSSCPLCRTPTSVAFFRGPPKRTRVDSE